MKESINYYYNLNIDEIETMDKIYHFKINNDNFYFVPFMRAESELKDLIEISKELKQRHIEAHDIIFNRFEKIVTTVFNQNYILLKPIGDVYEEYSITNIIKINERLILTPLKSKLYRNSWPKLWSDKIDYFEYQIHELGKDKHLILDTFSYYIGLGENAINYASSTLNKYKPTPMDKICLSHRRINFPNYKLNYLNPLSFIFDLEVRDIASFIKSSFIKGEDAISYLKSTLKIKRFTTYSLQLLYARLLYPTFYFDIYEKIMNNELEEDALIPIIEKSEDYEIFLKNAFNEINKYASIERVEWLLK